MIRGHEELPQFERRSARHELARISSRDAPALFAALCREALALGAVLPGDWRRDIAPDLAVARALTGLPPEA